MACIVKRRGKVCIDFYDQNGKRHLKTLPEGITNKDARRNLSEIERAVQHDIYISPVQVQQFKTVAKDWLAYHRPRVKESTIDGNDGHIRNHLNPFMGDTAITKVNFDLIEKFMQYARRHERKVGSKKNPKKKKLAEATIKKMLLTLGQILQYAVRKKYIPFNPVHEVEKPKQKGKDMFDFLQPHEIRALLEHTEGAKYKTLFLMAVMTGMRQGELLGLQWGDLDWINNQVCVRRTYNHNKFYPPKTEKSTRRIDLAPMVISELKAWKLQCPKGEFNLVFPNQLGNPEDCMNLVRRNYQPALRRAGLRQIRFHDLRHTFASLLIDQGEHPKYIQSQMGHGSINVTMDTYGHLMQDTNSQAPLKLQNAIFKKSGDKMVTRGVKTDAEETIKALTHEDKCLINGGNILVSRAGLEPTTYGLKVRCSTN